jgi:hypothetical protein
MHGDHQHLIMVLGGMAFGAATDLALVHVLRFGLRRCTSYATANSGLLWLVLTMGSVLGLSLSPIPVLVHLARANSAPAPQSGAAMAVFVAIPLNALDVAFAVLFAGLVGGLLLHRFLWESVARPISFVYSVFPNNKVVGGVGLALTLYGTGVGVENLKAILSALIAG